MDTAKPIRLRFLDAQPLTINSFSMRRAAAIFIAHFILWAVVSQVNHALSGRHVFLWVGGLYVTFAALALPLRSGIAASFLAGLLADATAPVMFGTHAMLYSTAHAFVFNVRDRIPRDETTGRVIAALFANLALFLVFSFIQIDRVPTPSTVWPRLMLDLLCSQFFIVLVAPWFFALQSRLLDASDALAHAYIRRFQ